MRRLLLPVIVGLVVGTVAWSAGALQQAQQPVSLPGEKTPWTSLNYNDSEETFRFAVVSDRTGGHRAEIFSKAVAYLNMMQPEFVLSVGDLIEGYSEKEDTIAGMWKEFDSFITKLQVPFFHVPGNHDVTNNAMRQYWKSKFGKVYYHFLYKNVLFLCLNTEDFPEGGKGTRISEEQTAYFAKVLEENKNVRWTVVALHKPVWASPDADTIGFTAFEKLLLTRPYTVFAGHVHHYQKFVRHGRNYYQLATTGGGSKLRGDKYGEFDHITWVTMKKDGPVLANVLLSGILPEDLSTVQPVAEEKAAPVRDRRDTYMTSGTLLYNGKPLESAEVVFYYQVPAEEQLKTKGQKQLRAADGLTDSKGRFTLSTYTNGDGAPKGEYIITVIPFKSRTGQPVPVFELPAKYAKPATSPLTATIKPEKNELTLEIRD